MSVQIALRLSEAVVGYIDDLVATGRAKSRADAVTRFVERDRRRVRAAQDVERLIAERKAGDRSDDGLDAVAAISAATPLSDLD